jgi:SAM-dependent methyltransferase
MNKITSEDFYSKVWINDWQDMERLNPTARHLEAIISKIIHQIGGIKNLLDIGCGIGVNIKRININHPDIKVSGSDLTEDIIKLARKYVNNPDVNFILNDISKNSVNDKFDLVLCSQVLEHIEDDVAALKNIYKISKKYILITVPSGNYNSTSTIVGHCRHYSRSELLQKVGSSGFKVISVFEWGFPFHSLYKYILGSLPIRAQKKMGFGKYGLFKKLISNFLFTIFYFNSYKRGQNIILLGEKFK